MSNAAVAEQLHTRTHERYAASLSTLYKLGAAGLSGEGIVGAQTLAFDDFATKVGEMLKTDEVYGETIDIERPKLFAYRDGHVRAADGRPMVDVVRKGFRTSRQSQDGRIRTTQAERDEGDVIIAEAVDELKVGQALFAMSVEPKKELSGADAKFWYDRGYRKGIAYLQVYHRVSETEMWTGTFSIRHSDVAALRQMFARKGKHVPADVDANNFIRHHHTIDIDQGQTAGQVALDMRRQYYRDRGVPEAKYSVEHVLSRRENAAFLRTMFDTYYPEIGGALISKHNTPVLQDFARDALERLPADKLANEVRTQLIRIANSANFDDAMARALDDIIPYAAKEHLRTSLRAAPRTAKEAYATEVPTTPPQEAARYPQPGIAPEQMQRLALAGLSRGVSAGRSGGGCAGVKLSKTGLGESELDDPLTPQDAYGGKGDSQETQAGSDRYGPLTFKCTEGHTNTRKRGELLTQCQHTPCKKGSVGCK